MASLYLLCYNTVLFAGWSYCMYLTTLNILDGGSIEDLWKKVEVPLKIFQTSALFEIAHSALKWVRSPLIVTTMQVFSRIWIVWGIINPVQFITTKQSVVLAKLGPWSLQLNLTTLLVAWSLAEIIRYSFYALKEINIDSYLSKWLRYSGFTVLYPLGVASEISLVYLALPYIKTSHLWSLSMPNALNFGFSYHALCILATFCYLPLEIAFLKWLRYTMFIPLYPLGVGSELALVYLALPALTDLHLWSISMPNSLNFAFHYYIYVIIYSLLYLPFFPQLYLYMFAQRRKVLTAKPKAE